MRHLVPLTLLLASACGLDEARFVTRQAEQDCAYALECFSDPMLSFQGWTDQETCEATHGPTLAAVAASCTEFDDQAAKECIKAMNGRSCAGEGPSLDRPAACDVVFSSCEGGDT